MNSSRPRRPFGLWAYLGTMLATAVVAGVAGGLAAVLGDRPGWIGFGINAALIGAAMAIGLGLCVWWWRGIDEAAQEAHKWAWWWGGTGGMAFGGVILLSLLLPDRGEAFFRGIPGQDLVAYGMGVVVVSQVIGYSIAWVVWWLRHR